MAESKRLAAHRASVSAASKDPELDPNETEPDDDGDDAPKSKKKAKEPKPMEDENCNADAIAQARADERARFNAVLASDNYAGRETLAQSLLANDKLSADEIVTLLAAAGPVAPAAATASEADAEDAARAEMQAALADNANSNIDAGAPPAVAAGNDGSVWDQAYALCNFKSA